MHTVIDDTVAILRRTIDKKITIVLNLDAELHTIMGDWSQLQNGLLNIGINAGHAMPDGGTLSFCTRALELDELFCQQNPFEIRPGWFIEVIIQDTGCGISPENMKRIFEPFFTTKKQGKGTGLGLAAVYGTAVQHGGAVSVYSEIDRGTEFHLLLPLCEDCRAEAAIPDAKVIAGQGCILIIDDEPIVRMTAKMMLERLGYHTAEAQNGQEGVDIYRAHREAIDLILLDMLMPVMDGTECFRALQQLNPAVKIIISSGFSRDADLAEMKRQGLCAFIRKPYKLAELSREVAQALR
ncbi:MAG: signal transduction histidine kinase, nitrogen specific, NtrB [uncultured bacterium]|nr:MAG: signal transduction histidine kinase, nitrogen specific, NtrB [uncultured bacterium]